MYWLRGLSCLILNRDDGPGKWKGGGVACGSEGVGDVGSEGGVSEVEVRSCAITTQDPRHDSHDWAAACRVAG